MKAGPLTEYVEIVRIRIFTTTAGLHGKTPYEPLLKDACL